MIDKSKLSTALRQKFRDPRAVLRRLGIDEDLLARSGAGNDDPGLREAGERGGISGAHIVKIMDFLAGKLDAATMAELNLLLDRLLGKSIVAANNNEAKSDGRDNGDEDDHERRQKLGQFLKSKGMGDDFVHRALDMLPRAGFGGRLANKQATDSADSFARMFGSTSHIEAGSGSPGMAFDYQRRPRSGPSVGDVEAFNKFFGITSF